MDRQLYRKFVNKNLWNTDKLDILTSDTDNYYSYDIIAISISQPLLRNVTYNQRLCVYNFTLLV